MMVVLTCILFYIILVIVVTVVMVHIIRDNPSVYLVPFMIVLIILLVSLLAIILFLIEYLEAEKKIRDYIKLRTLLRLLFLLTKSTRGFLPLRLMYLRVLPICTSRHLKST